MCNDRTASGSEVFLGGEEPDRAACGHAARWKSGNEQVSETSQRVTPKHAMAPELHIQKPDGWPTGDYHVDILVNGEKVATKDFEVKAGT